LAPAGRAELCASFALPFSAECLKCVTGLTNARYQDMDDWSQGMIDGIANYAGHEMPARSHRHGIGHPKFDPVLPCDA
jgi:hypothetical protein